MYITFEDADKIREALMPNAAQDKRYEAIGILDAAEDRQRKKNERTIRYIQDKRKTDRSYARPNKQKK